MRTQGSYRGAKHIAAAREVTLASTDVIRMMSLKLSSSVAAVRLCPRACTARRDVHVSAKERTPLAESSRCCRNHVVDGFTMNTARLYRPGLSVVATGWLSIQAQSSPCRAVHCSAVSEVL